MNQPQPQQSLQERMKERIEKRGKAAGMAFVVIALFGIAPGWSFLGLLIAAGVLFWDFDSIKKMWAQYQEKKRQQKEQKELRAQQMLAYQRAQYQRGNHPPQAHMNPPQTGMYQRPQPPMAPQDQYMNHQTGAYLQQGSNPYQPQQWVNQPPQPGAYPPPPPPQQPLAGFGMPPQG